MTDFLILDVFTETPFGGNQLAVIPDATGVPEDRLQKIAREFNFPETTFVTPPVDPAHTARVRIFTPTSEIPFAGHPVIGTAVALAGLGRGPEMTFELGVGPLPVRAETGHARFETRVPLRRGASPEPEAVARCLGLGAGDLASAPLMAGVGLDFVFAELAGTEALGRCRPASDAFAEAAARWPSPLDFAVFAWVLDGAEVQARMFAPQAGIPEDPATGSAAAALAAHLAETRGVSRLAIRQGEAMGRPSRIATEVTLEDGRAAAVAVSGSAVRVAEGRLLAP